MPISSAVIETISMRSVAIDRFKTASQRHLRVALSFLVTMIVLAISVMTFVRIDHELERNRTVQSDNRTWVLAQIEVDLQNLRINLLQAVADPDAAVLDDLRLAYDILYSRVHVVTKTPNLQELSLRQTPAWKTLAGEGGLMSAFLPVIDGPDAALRVALPEMIQRAEHLALPVREAIAVSLGEAMALGDATRLSLQRTLYSFMVAILVILLGLMLLFGTIYRQSRAQQRYARTLELAVQNLRATIESAPDAVLIVNANGLVIAANSAGEVLLGRAPTQGDPVALSDMLPDHARARAGQKAQMDCHGRDAQIVPVEVTIADVATGMGDTLKIAFLRDMSDQLDRERQLADATELARKGEEAKDRFLAVMSHEMRTPLSGLLSATDLLETTTTLDEPQAWLVGVLKSCGQAALEQVNNILELTRLAASDANEFPHTDFCVHQLVRDQVKLYQALALDRGNLLTLSPEDAPPCMVHAPVPLVRRILNNLLSNAIKFTRNGAIDVVFMVKPSDRPGYRHFTMLIRDTGIGIPEADLERIFHNFETLDSSYSRVQEGTGLGLGIAKLSAEAMGGTIRVDSRVGEGTCFTVTFEAELVPEVPAEVAAAQSVAVPHRALKILLAEDNEINSALMDRQLTRLGHTVVTASDGIKAIAAVQGQRFDIILMDISMPHMDGLTATRHLIECDLLGTTPVVALTAQASPDKVEMLCDAGMADVVIKPVPMARLDDLMQNLINHRSPSGAVSAPLAADLLLDRPRLDELVEVLGGAEMRKLSEQFRAEVQRMQSSCAAAIKIGNLTDVAKAAHKTAGAAGTLTLNALCAALRALENAAADEPAEALVARLGKIDQLGTESLHALHRALNAPQGTPQGRSPC